MSVLETISSWPVVIQGAIGSALVWAVLYVGQKVGSLITSKISEDKELGEFFALAAWSSSVRGTSLSKRAFFTCIYGSIHYFLKSFIVFALIGAVSPFNEIFAVVGYVFLFYYTFRAISYVPHRSSIPDDVDERLSERVESILEDA